MFDELVGERRFLTLLAGLSPMSAWWSTFKARPKKPAPLEGAAAEAYFATIA